MPSISLVLFRMSAVEALNSIKQAEQMGIKACWLPTPPFSFDIIPVLSAAGAATSQIVLGSGITPTYPRHPIALATEVLSVAELSQGRFRLGVGPSHTAVIESALGLSYAKPLKHLREYITVLRSYLQEGKVDFEGEYYHVHAALAPWSTAPKTPIYMSANRPKAFELAGAVADGVMSSWEPIPYLREIAVPAVKRAAEDAGRPRPRVIGHIAVIPTEDHDTAFQVAYQTWEHAYKPMSEPYVDSYRLVGLSLLENRSLSSEVFDQIFVYGSEAQIRQRFYDMLSIDGVDEVMVTIHPVGDPVQDEIRVLKMMADLEEEFARA
jgi:alkanesulfonate monooxygenase SsuD/methylene tetrahydromethanopterin reductase-like flavin-dependent oxidoreductase (luciferase family)